MESGVLYPKPLPELVIADQPYESGFLPNEVVALKHVWRLIKRRLLFHTSTIFMELFNANISLLDRFRKENSEKFNLIAMHSHPYQLMYIYEKLIESGLNDLIVINALLYDVSESHKSHGVTYEEIKLHTDYINEYLIIFFEKIKSATMVNALNKLGELINEHHKYKPEIEQRESVDENKDTP